MPRGTGVSPGIGLARALLLQGPIVHQYIPRECAEIARELSRLEDARRAVIAQNSSLRDKTARQFGAKEAAIFDAYEMMLEDEDGLLNPIRGRIRRERLSAEHAVFAQMDGLARQFMQLDDDYLRQRADDVIGLRDQLMRELTGRQSADASHLDEPTVVVAHTLSPADIAALDLSRLEGMVCETGGYSSHISIICRTLGVPAVVGAGSIGGAILNGSLLALDGDSGEIWVNPDAGVIQMLRRRADELAGRRQQTLAWRGRPTVSTDGRRVELTACVGQLDEVDRALEADAEAVGMFRTELLHLAFPPLPSEDEQFGEYRALLEKLGGKSAAVRTFDDGGNRPALPLKNRQEDNPVLGYRGIRMSLGRPSFFRTQLRALLRASAYGSLKVLFPMVCSLDEVQAALDALEAIKAELRQEGLPFDEKLPVGILVETPAAALLSGAIAPMVDFLVIGINDLLQFTLAIDRGNPDLAHLYHLDHPAILRLVRWTVEAAHAASIPCTLCGDAPRPEQMLPLMLGLGVDGFSVTPSTLLQARRILGSHSYAGCKKAADEILALNSTAEVARRLGEVFGQAEGS